MTARTHSCGNCIMWSRPEGSHAGICELGDQRTAQGFDGNGVMKDDNQFWTTPETYCDWQSPIPPPGPPCPACAAPLIEGFGLAGGGYGPYEVCDGCGYFNKHQLLDDES